MHKRIKRPSPFATAVIACIALSALFIMAMGLSVGGPTTSRYIDDVAEGITPLIAAGFCARTAKRNPTNSKAWWLLGSSALSWAAGEGVWCYYEIGLGTSTPFPSLADAGYLLAVPLALLGLIMFHRPSQGFAGRLRNLFDGVLIAGSLLFLSWATVLGPLFRTHADTLLSKVLSLAYPAGDVVLASLVLFLATTYKGATGNRRGALPYVLVAVLAFAVSDTSFAYLTQVHSYSGVVSRMLDTGWFSGYLVLALGALRFDEGEASYEAETEKPLTKTSILIPYIPLALAGAIAVQRLLSDSMELFLWIEGFVLLAVMSARQLLTLFDNMSLNRKLTAKVVISTAELHDHQARFSALVEHASDLVTIADEDGRVSFHSPSMARVLGWSADDDAASNWLRAMHPADIGRWNAVLGRLRSEPSGVMTAEWRLKHKDGSWRYLQSVVTNLSNERSVGGFVLNSRDVTDNKALEDQLRHQAFHDPLTGLANRALFAEHLEHAVRRRMRSGLRLSVLFVDLDDFKNVNDLRGHSIGDEVIKQVADRLNETLREADLIARLGGDEFAVLLEDTASDSDPALACRRVIEAMSEPFEIGGSCVTVRASVGVAIDDPGCETADELLRNADVAMYSAKVKGKAGFEIYSPAMHSSILERMKIEEELDEALQQGELFLEYQPLIDSESGTITAAEALVRWNNPKRGVVLPNEFIPVAESSELIVKIGKWVLKEACREAQSWPEHLCGEKPVGLMVNLSARQLADKGIITMIEEALDDSGLDPTRLTLEITESMIVHNPDKAAQVLAQLRSRGIKISIDDFGTGYSSLGSLRDFPVDVLKVDRSFVTHLGTSANARRLAKTILQLALDLGLETVVEGVEYQEQVDSLKELGYRSLQGFYFSRPIAPEQLRHRLENQGHDLPAVVARVTPSS